MSNLEYMFHPGFYGTRSPFFMDVVISIVPLLPFLVIGAIMLAKKKHYKAHAIVQITIFAVSVIVLSYFEYGVRVSGGFSSFMEGSGVGHNYAFIVLVFHIAISVITLLIWGTTIFTAKKQLQLNKHKRAGYLTFGGVIATSLTGVWVYFLMFVY